MVMENTHGTIPKSNLALQDSNVQICTKVCIPTQTENITAEDKLISGTYCHPDLIPHIACGHFPGFNLIVSRIFIPYILDEYKATFKASEDSVAHLLMGKKQTIRSARGSRYFFFNSAVNRINSTNL